jgi:hypothetical protein
MINSRKKSSIILFIGASLLVGGFSTMFIFSYLLNSGDLEEFMPEQAFRYQRSDQSNWDYVVERYGIFAYVISGSSYVGQGGIAILVLGALIFLVNKKKNRK